MGGVAANIVPQLPLMRYRLRFRVADADSLAGRYLGSAWRGAFGHALRRTVCIMGLPPSCDDCALLASCVYPRTFENRPAADAKKLTRYPTAPNPYVFEPATNFDAKDDTLNLGLTLFGKTNDDAPTVLQALQRAARGGLTNARATLELTAAQAERLGAEGEAWLTVRDASGSLKTVSPHMPHTPTVPDAVRVHLLSPLRARRDERNIGPSQFDFRAFAANLLRRISLLTYFFGETALEVDFAALLRQAETIELENVQLRWRELSRCSSRQRAIIPMGGLTGAFTVRSPKLAAFWPCLWLGQWTHLGKGCTMGLGRYALEPLDSEAGSRWSGPASL